MEIDEMLETYKNIKEEINNIQYVKQDNDFLSLVNLKGVDDDLKQYLILLHSNYSTEIKEIRSNANKILYKMVDESEYMLRAMHTRMKKAEEHIEKNAGKATKQSRALITLGAIMVVFVAAFSMASFDPQAFDKTVGSIKHIVSLSGILPEVPRPNTQAADYNGAELPPAPAAEEPAEPAK